MCVESVVMETCRLSSGVFMIRHVNNDTRFVTSDGRSHLIGRGHRVAMYPPAIHKDPEIFERPMVGLQMYSSNAERSSWHILKIRE